MSFELGPVVLPPIRVPLPDARVLLVPVRGPQGPPGPPGDLDDLEAVQGLIDDTVEVHVQAVEPHPAYDDLPSLRLLFENGLI